MENRTINSTSIDFCNQASMITGTYQMKSILVLESIFGPLSILPNILNIILLFRVKVFHSNLRLLLGHLSFDLMFYSLSISIKAIRRLSILNPCDLSMSIRKCIVEEWSTAIPINNVLLALLVLYLERVYCTLKFRTYDTSKSKPYLAGGLLTCTWITTLSFQFSIYFKAPTNILVPVCENGLYTKPENAAPAIGVFISLEILAIALLIFVYIYNRFALNRMVINRAQFDLSARFQVDQNVKVNSALMPLAILHEICYLPTYIFLFSTLASYTQFDLVTRAWMIHLTYLWRIVYACVQPALLIFMNPNLKRGFFKTPVGRALLWIWKYMRKQNQVENVKETAMYVADLHFDMLTAMWNSGTEPILNKERQVQKIRNGTDGIQVAWTKSSSKVSRLPSRGETSGVGGTVQIRLNSSCPIPDQGQAGVEV